MNNKNICKLVSSSATEKLDMYQFIYETNINLTQKNRLHHNRAILIKQGFGKIEIDNVLIEFQAGNLIICFKDEELAVYGEKGCEYLYIDFDGERSDILFRRFYIGKGNRVFDGFDGLIPLWYEGICKAVQENLDLLSESILLYTFSRLAVTTKPQKNIVDEIIKISEESFNNPKLSISSLADELSYNAKYLSHVFKKTMGISYSEYLRNIRIKYAVSLLEHGIDSVKNIAFLSGFSDPLYFSSLFKKTVGVSPKEYKKRFLSSGFGGE